MALETTVKRPASPWWRLGLVVLVWWAAPVQAQNNLRVEIAALSKSLRDQLKGRDASSLALGPFAAQKETFSNYGPGILQAFRDELPRAGVTIDGGAAFTLRGVYEVVKEEESKGVMIKLSVKLTDRNGRSIGKEEVRGIWGEETVTSMLGMTVELPPKGDLKTRTDDLVKIIEDGPKVHVQKARVAPSATCPYGLEVQVLKGESYKPREPAPDKQRDGHAYVAVARDEVYGILVYNDSEYEAAVTLTVDGINVFEFWEPKDEKTGRPPYSTFILPPHSSHLIKGWPTGLKTSDQFKVTEYAKSASRELNSPEPVGVITASFAAAWPKDGKPPADEPEQVPPQSRSGDATGRGAQIESQFMPVQRKFGVLRATISVRYTK